MGEHSGSGSVAGQHYTSHDPKRTADPDRVCSHPECSTKLSIYNDSDRCSLHRRAVIRALSAKRRTTRRDPR